MVALQGYQIFFLNQFSSLTCVGPGGVFDDTSSGSSGTATQHSNSGYVPPSSASSASSSVPSSRPASSSGNTAAKPITQVDLRNVGSAGDPPSSGFASSGGAAAPSKTSDLLAELSQLPQGSSKPASQAAASQTYTPGSFGGGSTQASAGGGALSSQAAQPVVNLQPQANVQQAVYSNTNNMQAAGGSSANNQQPRLVEFLKQHQPYGLGVMLGIGRSDLCYELLSEWTTSPGLYLVDPFIRLWGNMDDKSSPDAMTTDGEHQLIFDRIHTRLKPFENRHSFVRDFSWSFVTTYRAEHQTPQTALVWIDNSGKYDDVMKDFNDWWPTITPRGVIAGPDYNHSGKGVKQAVDDFVKTSGGQLGFLGDQPGPNGEKGVWYIMKQY